MEIAKEAPKRALLSYRPGRKSICGIVSSCLPLGSLDVVNSGPVVDHPSVPLPSKRWHARCGRACGMTHAPVPFCCVQYEDNYLARSCVPAGCNIGADTNPFFEPSGKRTSAAARACRSG